MSGAALPSPTGAQLERVPLHVFHAAIDALEAATVPESYWRKVVTSRQQRASKAGSEYGH